MKRKQQELSKADVTRKETKRSHSFISGETNVQSDLFSDLLESGGFSFEVEGKYIATVGNLSLLITDLSARVIGIESQFMADLVMFVSSKSSNFLHLLVPVSPSVMELDKRKRTLSFFTNRDMSVFQALLKVEALQPQVIDLLLRSMIQFASGVSSLEPIFLRDRERKFQIQILELIISQIRWIELVYNPKQLARTVIELLDFNIHELTQALLPAIPEIITDAYQCEVVLKLEEVVTIDSSFLIPVLDAFSNFSIPPELADKTVSSMSQMVDAVPLETLPIFVRFLLHAATPNSIGTVIASLQKHLHFTRSQATSASFLLSAPNTARQGKKASNSQGTSRLVYEVIRDALYFKPFVCSAFVKAIWDIRDQRLHSPVDVIVLLILSGNSLGNAKIHNRALVLLRKKISSGVFTLDILRDVMLKETEAIEVIFGSVLELTANLFCCTNEKLRQWAAASYQYLFMALPMSMHRQAIIENVMTHVGSNILTEVETALNILHKLCEEDIFAMKPFTAFVKGLCYSLDSFPDRLVRLVFAVLTRLLTDLGSEVKLNHEFHIFLHKNISNSNLKYRLFGVIGITQLLQVIAPSSYDTHSSHILHNFESSATEWLNILLESSTRCIDTYSFALEELAFAVSKNQLHCSIVSKLEQSSRKNLDQLLIFFRDETNQSQNRQVIDTMKENSNNAIIDKGNRLVCSNNQSLLQNTQECEITHGLRFNLDPDCFSTAVKIAPLIFENDSADKYEVGYEAHALRMLCPSLRLLATCKLSLEGSFTDIDALVGSPLMLWNESTLTSHDFEKLSTEVLHKIASSLIYSINWIREVINAFSSQKDLEVWSKICKRIVHLRTLETELSHCFSLLPGDEEFVPFGFSSSISSFCINTKSSNSNDKNQITLTISRYFREFDIHIWKILTIPFAVPIINDRHQQRDYSSQASQMAFSQSQLSYLSQPVFPLIPSVHLFIVTELHDKLKLLLSNKRKLWFGESKNRQLRSESTLPMLLATYTPVSLLDVCSPAFASLGKHFRAISEWLICEDNSDFDYDGKEFESRNDLKDVLKSSMLKLLSMIELVLSCEELYDTEGVTQVKRILLSLSSCEVQSSSDVCEISVVGACLNAFLFIERGVSIFKSIFSEAVLLARCLKSILFYPRKREQYIKSVNSAIVPKDSEMQFKASANEEDEIDKASQRLCNFAEKCLQTDWKSSELNLKFSAQTLGTLVFIYIRTAKNSLSIIKHLVDGVLPTIATDTEGLSFHATLNKKTFSYYFKVVIQELVISVSSILADCVLKEQGKKARQKKIFMFLTCADLFYKLVMLASNFPRDHSVLGATMKYSKAFLEAALMTSRNWLFIDSQFKLQQSSILSFFRTIQQTTRKLHSISAHGKEMKDTSMVVHIPGLKRTIEKSKFLVKQLFKKHDVLSYFKQSALRDRALDGSIIGMKAQEESDEEEEEEEEE